MEKVEQQRKTEKANVSDDVLGTADHKRVLITNANSAPERHHHAANQGAHQKCPWCVAF
jgi:hypothetical protein